MDSDQDSVPSGSMQLQNMKIVYSKKLQVFQEAQRRQAQLVQKLQTKVSKTDLSVFWHFTLQKLSDYCTLFYYILGSSVQKEVWRLRGARAGENFRVWKNEIVGVCRSLHNLINNVRCYTYNNWEAGLHLRHKLYWTRWPSLLWYCLKSEN